MKTLAIIAYFIVLAVVTALAMYMWVEMPCETIKEYNLNTPGRCLP